MERFRCQARISTWQPNDVPNARHPLTCVSIPQDDESRWPGVVPMSVTGINLKSSRLEGNRLYIGVVDNRLTDTAATKTGENSSHSATDNRCLCCCSVCFDGTISILLLTYSHACIAHCAATNVVKSVLCVVIASRENNLYYLATAF